MAPKRGLSVAAGNGLEAPSEKRSRADGGIPEPAEPPSPRRRLLRRTVLVVLFSIRAKDRNMGNMDFSLSQIGRVVREQIRHCLGPIVSKLESMDGRICALTQKVDNITSNSCSDHNHKQHMQKTNQEGNSAEAEGLATNEGKGKRTRIRLQFLNGMKSLIYQEDEIRSDSDSAIRIGIFDGNNTIKSGQLSTLKIEILVLNGDFPYDASDIWTSEEFNDYRVGGREGKGNVLAGKCTVRLINGEVDLNNIKFIKGSCSAPNKMFIVGARVCDCEQTDGRIQEAVMNPVVVQDRRNKYNEKSHPPNLDDGVYRLEKISINGKYRKRLEKKNICTLEHFLKALYKDEDNLAGILKIKKKSKDWDKMVHHAQECCLQGKTGLKSYACEERNAVLFFNYVHRLVGARFGCRYISSDMFDPAQQNLVDKLKKNAYDQLDSLTEDHIMKDNIPVPICMNTDGGAGPSYMTSATQQKNSGHHIAAHQVGGTPASEVLSPHAPPEPLRENANNAHGPNSIPDPNSTHNYQVGGIPAVEGLSHGLNESPFAIANDRPIPSFSIPDHLTIENSQDQGTGLAGQEQYLPFLNGMYLDSLDAQAFYFGVTDVSDMHLYEEDDEPAFLLHQADTNNWGAPGFHQGEMQSLVGWPGNDTTPQLLNNTGAPGSDQGNMQNQTQASLPNDGTTHSAQQALPPHQWS